MRTFNIEFKWAFIFIGSLMLWMLLERAVGLHDQHINLHQYLTMLYAIPAILIYVLALRDKRKNFYHGKLSYKNGFISGLIITVIVAILSPVTQWIILNVITPGYFGNVIQYSVESGVYQSVAEAQAQFNYNTYAVQSTISALFMGIVTTAIVAFFVRTRNDR